MTCSVRLWDGATRLIATEHGCAEPRTTQPELSITILGDGPISAAVRAMVERTTPESAWYVTVDFDQPFKNRVAAAVTRLHIDERECECGQSKIVTTSIGGAPELVRPRTLADS